MRETKKEKSLRLTKKFIDSFLCYDDGNVVYDKYNINNIKWIGIKRKMICNYIRCMEYRYFLNTPYWKIISSFIKYRDGYKCQICGSDLKLNVHHIDYEYHGRELYHLRKLICLCEKCHRKQHNLI